MREPLRLTLTAAPARLPVELGEVRAQLRLDDDQTIEDALVAGIVRAAVEACECFTGRALITQTWTLVRDRWPGGSDDVPISEGLVEGPDIQPSVRALMLPRPPLRSVTHVKTFDENDAESTWPPANYLVDTASQPGRLVARTGRAFPTPGRAANGIEVLFVAGQGDAPGDVPMALRHGLLQLAAHMFEHRGDGASDTALNASGAAALWQPFVVRGL